MPYPSPLITASDQDRRELLLRDPEYRTMAGWIKKPVLSIYTYFADEVYILCPEKIYFIGKVSISSDYA